jgi:hypothetical protein
MGGEEKIGKVLHASSASLALHFTEVSKPEKTTWKVHTLPRYLGSEKIKIH